MAPSNDTASILSGFIGSYQKNTSQRLKICDAFIVFFLLNALTIFLYCVLIGSYPFNAYLSGLFANVGMAVFTVCLRMQAAPANKPQFRCSSVESSFSDYCLCSVLLLLTAVHFMG
eukprot:TRINITY_DN10393_c0_g1_i1.p1 TRINITY_DN10393_c0_g1~~TRINITY_DN10393_c0_g1_i1.p1  ORF type:complete len:116 (+),score=53.12 TRINITY_DN10393_c0_g1_i1:182-529(+)